MSFLAQYHGQCANDCGEAIIPGQRIEVSEQEEGRYEHEICGARPEVATECACERCFLVHAPQQDGCY